MNVLIGLFNNNGRSTMQHIISIWENGNQLTIIDNVNKFNEEIEKKSIYNLGIVVMADLIKVPEAKQRLVSNVQRYNSTNHPVYLIGDNDCIIERIFGQIISGRDVGNTYLKPSKNLDLPPQSYDMTHPIMYNVNHLFEGNNVGFISNPIFSLKVLAKSSNGNPILFYTDGVFEKIYIDTDLSKYLLFNEKIHSDYNINLKTYMNNIMSWVKLEHYEIPSEIDETIDHTIDSVSGTPETKNKWKSIVHTILKTPSFNNLHTYSALLYASSDLDYINKVISVEESGENQFCGWFKEFAYRLYDLHMGNTKICPPNIEIENLIKELPNQTQSLKDEIINNFNGFINHSSLPDLELECYQIDQNLKLDLSLACMIYSIVHQKINHLLMSNPKESLKKYPKLIYNLDLCLKSLAIDGQQIVYRGQQEIPKNIKEWKVGQDLSFPTFTSTSLNSDTAQCFCKDGIIFKINLYNIGANIGKFSEKFFGGNEILLPAYSKLKILKISEDPKDIICKWLIELECNNNNNNNNNINLVGRKNNDEILKNLFVELYAGNVRYFEQYKGILTKENVDSINDRSQTLLYIASSKGYLDQVIFLLGLGANVNAMKNETTPLHAAAYGNHTEIVAELLKKGADIKIKNKHNFSAIEEGWVHEGIRNTFLKYGFNRLPSVSETLYLPQIFKDMEQGKTTQFNQFKNSITINNIETTNERSETLLYVACQYGLYEVVEQLLSKKANINSNTNGSTPLHVAARGGHTYVVLLLLSSGALTNLKNNNGKTAFEEYGRMSEEMYEIFCNCLQYPYVN